MSSKIPEVAPGTPAAEDPIARMKAVMAKVAEGTAGEVNDVLRTADALSTTWNRMANPTQQVRPVSEPRAAKLLPGK